MIYRVYENNKPVFDLFTLFDDKLGKILKRIWIEYFAPKFTRFQRKI